MRRAGDVRIVYLVTLILSACSLLYEFLIAQTMSMLAANMVVWYSLTVGTYLATMGLGALLCDPLFRRRDAWSSLFLVEICLTVAGSLSVIVLSLAHTLHSYYYLYFHTLQGAFAFFGAFFVLTCAVGILTGLELPLLIRLGNESATDGKVTNRVLGIDYLGALLGGMLFPLVLVPNLELIAIGFLTASVNLAVAGIVLVRVTDTARARTGKAIAAGTLAVGLAAGLLHLGDVQQYLLKKYYYYRRLPDGALALWGSMAEFPDVRRFSSPYQKIDIVTSVPNPENDVLIDAYSTKFLEKPSYPRDRHLFLNHDWQLSSDYEEIYHEYLAHAPILRYGKVPARVLVLGAGDGLLNRELLKHEGIEQITHVDLDREMIALAKSDPVLSSMNEGSLDDPRVRTIIGDAYQFVRTTDETFDAIYLDFPYPMDYNLAKLYSREFYHFVRNRLAPDGFAVLEAMGLRHIIEAEPGTPVREEWLVYYNTIRQAGFGTVLPFVSEFEVNDLEAFRLVESSSIDLDDDRYAVPGEDGVDRGTRRRMRIEGFIRDHVRDMRTGFVMMRREDVDRPSYRDFDIPLHVLTLDRAKRAFELGVAPEGPVDPRYVNSIMRPRLPVAPFWFTRVPW